ncbi:MAG: hypothetical protein NTU86_07330 [Burkholderiales bacterium]|nr:hypothetical protein [Burkholderiales bacterium]
MEFHYQAANSQGQVLSGQISAASEREAMRALQQQNLTPISIDAPADAATVGGRHPKSQ